MIITFLSSISFEMYLVHEFLLGKYSVFQLTDNIIYGYLILLAGTVLMAYLLMKTSKIISTGFSKIFSSTLPPT